MTKNKKSEQTENSRKLPTVVRAAKSDDGQKFYEIEMNGDRAWISSARLAGEEAAVFRELAEQNVELITTELKTHLKKEVQAYDIFEVGAVASQPGWFRHTLFVYPDGTHDSDNSEEVVFPIFEKNTDYGEHGRLVSWRKGLTPFVLAQPILLFFLMFALLPLLQRKLKLPLLSPALEIVGDPQCGKSTLVHLMGSVHGGNPDSAGGLARSADFTKQSFKPLQRLTNDSLLLFDETNIVDKSVAESQSLVFQLTATDDRARFTDTERKQPVRNALVLTGNRPLEDQGSIDPAVLAAARSRIITYRLKRPLFDTQPDGFVSNQAACKALILHCNEHYGTPSRKFVRKLIERSEDLPVLSEKIETLMRKFKENVVFAGAAEGRLLDVFALSYAAGQLASEWRIFSKHWPDPLATTLQVFSSLYGGQGDITLGQKWSPAKKKLLEIIESERARFVIATTSKLRSANQAKHASLGYYKRNSDGDIWVFFDPKEAKRSGLDIKLLKSLRDEGILIGENGSSPKLVSKVPSYVPLKGRVYKVVLHESDLPEGLFARKRRKRALKRTPVDKN